MDSLQTRLQYLMDTCEDGPISPTRLAAISGVSQPNITRILDGNITEPRRTTLVKLADALGANLDWLMTGNGPVKKDNKQIHAQENITFFSHLPSDFLLVPVLDSPVRFTGDKITMNFNKNYVVPFFGKGNTDLFGAAVTDNSMLGYEKMSLAKGGVAIIDPHCSPEPDRVIAARLNDSLLFGIYNKFGDTITVTSYATRATQDIKPSQIIGTVVGSFQGIQQ